MKGRWSATMALASCVLYARRLAKRPQSVTGSNVWRHLPVPYQHARNVQSSLDEDIQVRLATYDVN